MYTATPCGSVSCASVSAIWWVIRSWTPNRLVTRRFGVQERMTHQIAETLANLTEPHGVAVYMEAHHLCTQMRGVREVQPITRTTAFIGAYEGNSSLRSEFYDLAGLQRGVRE